MLRDRVAGWRQKILPVFEEQDAREAFDIHSYGDRILGRLTQLTVSCTAPPAATEPQLPSGPIALTAVLSDSSQWQISRYHCHVSDPFPCNVSAAAQSSISCAHISTNKSALFETQTERNCEDRAFQKCHLVRAGCLHPCCSW